MPPSVLPPADGTDPRPIEASREAEVRNAIEHYEANRESLAAELSALDERLDGLRSVLRHYAELNDEASRLLAAEVRTIPPSRSGTLVKGSLPEQIFAVLTREPDRVFSVRELAEAVHGHDVTSAQLETTRKSAIRLVKRGRVFGSSSEGFTTRKESI